MVALCVSPCYSPGGFFKNVQMPSRLFCLLEPLYKYNKCMRKLHVFCWMLGFGVLVLWSGRENTSYI